MGVVWKARYSWGEYTSMHSVFLQTWNTKSSEIKSHGLVAAILLQIWIDLEILLLLKPSCMSRHAEEGYKVTGKALSETVRRRKDLWVYGNRRNSS